MPIKSLLIGLVTLAATAGEVAAQKPVSRHQNARAFYESALPVRARPLAVIEIEPNDDAASATIVQMGDQATGEIDQHGAVDFFAVSISGGTTIDFDIDAFRVGSQLDPVLVLYDTDGVTELARNDDFDGLDSRIQFDIVTDGVYFVAIEGSTGGPDYFYRTNFNVLTNPPGDPTTIYATGFDGPLGMAFDGEGNLFVAEYWSGQISRVATDGSISVFAEGVPFPRSLAFDGEANLLVASEFGTIFKVSSLGVLEPFITNLFFSTAIAVTRTGDIWVASSAGLSRYSQDGVLVENFFAPAAFALAISPADDVYFTNGSTTVFKIEGSAAVPFIVTEPFIEGLAFDVDGNLYVANGFVGKVDLYDPDGDSLAIPFADDNLGGPINLAFGRDPNGSTNARLFAANLGFGLLPPYAGGIVEMNPAGIRAPGWPLGTTAGPRDIMFVVSTSDVDALPGQEFEIPVFLNLAESGETVATYDVELVWDSDLLEFADLDTGDFTTSGGWFTANTEQAHKGIVHAVAAEPEGRGGQPFTLFTLEVESSRLPAGAEIPISVRLRELADPLANSLRARVLVESPGICARGFGDVNGDEQVTGADAVQILRWLVGLTTVDGFDVGLADVDADREVGVADVLQILRFLVDLRIPSSSRLGSGLARGCTQDADG